MMTKAQLSKLDTILRKLEALQHAGITQQSDKDDLSNAKKYLMYALRRNDG